MLVAYKDWDHSEGGRAIFLPHRTIDITYISKYKCVRVQTAALAEPLLILSLTPKSHCRQGNNEQTTLQKLRGCPVGSWASEGKPSVVKTQHFYFLLPTSPTLYFPFLHKQQQQQKPRIKFDAKRKHLPSSQILLLPKGKTSTQIWGQTAKIFREVGVFVWTQTSQLDS